MERSQSCSNFERNFSKGVYNNINSGSNNRINDLNNRNFSSARSLSDLRKLIELRQNQLHLKQTSSITTTTQQYQQIKNEVTNMSIPCAIPHYVYNENLNSINALSLATLRDACQIRRKKAPLQRQKSTEYLDDVDYAADLEEDDEELDNEYDDESLHNNSNSNSNNKNLSTKQIAQPSEIHRTTLIIDTNTKNTIFTTSTTSSITDNSNNIVNNPPLRQLSQQQHHYNQQQHTHHRLPQHHPHYLSLDLNLANTTNPPLSAIPSSFSETYSSPNTRRRRFGQLKRDNSLHSDSSRYSSVDSLLDARKPDPEAILINLGFGPIGSEDILSRIPKRFLKPSQVRGIDTEAFVKRLQLASTIADHSVLGYRGLTGNPDIPPSTIVAKIMERFEVNERKKSMGSIEHHI